jgi:serine/threonine protein kinase
MEMCFNEIQSNGGNTTMLLTVGSSVKDANNAVYILDEIIGQGGFGYVFKAHRKSDGVIFAVKTMLPSFGDSATTESFKNEMRLAANVKGENIIGYEYIHSGDEFPDLPPYIIMEYADGGTLSQLLEQKRKIGEQFEQAELLCIFNQLANGMKVKTPFVKVFFSRKFILSVKNLSCHLTR